MDASSLWTVAVIAGLCAYTLMVWLVSRDRRQPGVIVVLCLLPIWTLIGALYVSTWRGGPTPSVVGAVAERYTFPIQLNSIYAETLAFYFTFAFAVVLGVALLPKGDQGALQERRGQMVEVMDVFPIRWGLALSGGVVLLEELLVRSLIAQVPGSSLYAADYNPVLSDSLSLKALHYLILAAGSLLVTCVTVVLVRASRNGNRVESATMIVAFVILIGLQVRIYLVMGERSEALGVALALAIGILTYGSRRRGETRKPFVRIAGALAVIALAYVTVVIGLSRVNSQSNREITSPLSYLSSPSTVWDYFVSDSLVGEAFPAHSSLYFMLERGVEPFQALPFLSTPYDIYAASVGLPNDAGFTIHPVAAWWLSVGPFAPLAAAIYLVALLAGFMWLARRVVRPSTAAIVFISSTWAFAVLAPVVLRAGPDGLRGTLTTALIVPILATWWLWYVAGRRLESHRRGTAAVGTPSAPTVTEYVH